MGRIWQHYLVRFKRIANQLNVSKDTFAVRLGSVLTGKALDIYSSLSPEIAADYDLLQNSLLGGFSKTPAGYCTDFRSAKIRFGETYRQFSIQLGRSFDQWFESYNLEKSYECQRSFEILDKFLASVSPEIRMFIKVRNVPDLDEAVTLADNWASAHGSYPKSSLSGNKSKKPAVKVPSSRERAK